CCKTTFVCLRTPENGTSAETCLQGTIQTTGISYAVVNGNRAAVKELNESMVRKWRKQENELRQVKKTKQSFCGNKASVLLISRIKFN
ncbi:hypothetical protein, partial [Paraclostridium dentum]|uniref:hypothetical protein n=1 Tax=Paraclostridium dentum TaxID=2662455 RepID=UPI003F33697A